MLNMHDGPMDLSNFYKSKAFYRLKACESTVTWWPSGFDQFEISVAFLGVSDRLI